MITVGMNTAGFEREMEAFRRKSEKGFREAVRNSVNKMQKMAKLKVNMLTRGSKTKTGNLVNNIIQKIYPDGFTGEVISNADYSQEVEDGQRPHTIRVVNKKVLAGPFRGRPKGWVVGKASKAMGYAVYGKKVQHPGTHPWPFMFPAWRYGQSKLEEAIKAVFR